jgi:hypothetical protein
MRKVKKQNCQIQYESKSENKKISFFWESDSFMLTHVIGVRYRKILFRMRNRFTLIRAISGIYNNLKKVIFFDQTDSKSIGKSWLKF